MAITAYTGLPGSGKSYSVVAHCIIPALESGRTVFTNIPLKQGRLADEYPAGRVVPLSHPVGFEDVAFFEMLKVDYAGALIVLDEAWRVFPSGTKQTQIPKAVQEYLTMHRHIVDDLGRSTDIVLVTQNLAQVCKFVQLLVEETFRSVKLTALGTRKRFRVDVYSGPAIGVNPPKTQMVRQIHAQRYDPAICAFYSSHTLSKTSGPVTESQTDGRGSIFSSWMFRLGAPLSLLVLFFGVKSLAAIFDKKPKGDASVVADMSQKSAPAVGRSAAGVSSGGRLQPSSSSRWRVAERYAVKVGVVSVDRLVLVDSAGARRVIPSLLCTGVGTELVSCTVDGEVVTRWSGSPPAGGLSVGLK